MVTSWLAAHRQHVPSHLWEARRREWTPDVSAAGWTRVLDEIGDGARPPGTLLVAEDRDGDIVGIGMVTAVDSIAVVDAVYVRPERQGEGVGSRLLRGLASAVAETCTTVELSVLAANDPARRFYELVGGEHVGTSTFEEEATELATAIYRWSIDQLLGLDPGRPASRA